MDKKIGKIENIRQIDKKYDKYRVYGFQEM